MMALQWSLASGEGDELTQNLVPLTRVAVRASEVL